MQCNLVDRVALCKQVSSDVDALVELGNRRALPATAALSRFIPDSCVVNVSTQDSKFLQLSVVCSDLHVPLADPEFILGALKTAGRQQFCELACRTVNMSCVLPDRSVGWQEDDYGLPGDLAVGLAI